MHFAIIRNKLFLLLFFVFIFISGCNSSSGGGESNGRVDKEKPSAPGAVTTSEVMPDNVTLTWPSASDNNGVKEYRIYRNDSLIGTVTGTSWTDTAATSDRSCYTVSAVDEAGNESLQSEALCLNTSNGRIKWTFRTETGVTGPVALDSNGIIYALDQKNLYAVNPDGSLKWKYTPDVKMRTHASPAITPDGSICFITEYCLLAVKQDGTLKWKYESIGGFSNVSISPDGTVYVSVDGTFKAINHDGTLKWESPGQADSSSIDQDGTIYTQQNSIIRTFESDGTPISRWPSYYFGSGPIVEYYTPHIIGKNGTLLVFVNNRTPSSGQSVDLGFFAIKQDGTQFWKNSMIRSWGHPVNGNDGTTYVCTSENDSSTNNRVVCALNEDGTFKWKSAGSSYNPTSLTVDSGGTVYVISQSGYLNAIGNDGTLKWKGKTGYSDFSPAIAEDGTIYTGSSDSNIYAVSSDSPGIAKGCWSRSHGDNTNSRCVLEKKTDQEPPSVPVNVKATAEASSIISLDWVASSDSLNPVTGYKIYRNGEYIGLHGRGFSDSGLDYTANYCYSISAVDAAGNESAKSSEICITPLQPADGVLKWKYRIEGSQTVPAIGNDGSIVLMPSYRRLALNPDGTEKWSYLASGGYMYESFESHECSIGSDGSIYAGSGISFKPDGTEKWKFFEEISEQKSPSIASDGTLYMSGNNAFCAVNPDGTLKWKYQDADSSVEGHSAIAHDGTVYISSFDAIYALKPDGNLKWKYKQEDSLYGYLAIGQDGTVYSIIDDYERHSLLAINPDGTLKWKISPGDTGMHIRGIVVGSDGTIYSGGSDGYFYAISPDGQIRWKYHDDNIGGFGSIVIGADGILYVGTSSSCLEESENRKEYLLALRPDGTLKWKYKAGMNPVEPYAIASDGTLYFGIVKAYPWEMEDFGYLCAIQTSSMGLDTNGWPKINHDNQNTGRMP